MTHELKIAIQFADAVYEGRKMNLSQWDAHLVLTAAARYALGRNTPGSLGTLSAIIDRMPECMPKTAYVIARDIGQAYGSSVAPVWAKWDSRSAEPDETELMLYDACIDNLREAGELEGFEWRRNDDR